jgi:thiosulfate/3-mercaptopyruvate sulfurtransferase
MKKSFLFPVLVLLMSFTLSSDVPWTQEQLMDPEKLVAILKDPKAKKPVIINTGTMRNIKTALKYGPVSDYKGFDQFKAESAKIGKDKEIVIYCGCCKMDHCPNIAPAFEHLQKNGYSKIKILNLKEDLVFDWVNKGYPMDAKQPF